MEDKNLAMIDANAALMIAYLNFNQALEHIAYDLKDRGLTETEISEFLKERKKICESLIKSIL